MDQTPISITELTAFRKETAGVQHRLHFNNAGASLPTDPVLQTVVDYLREEALYGGYETEAKYQPALQQVYRHIAQLIHANEDEIAVVENASTAWGLAFQGIAFEDGDEVITSEMEYVTNMLGILQHQHKKRIHFRVIPNDARGQFDLQALEAAITPRTRLIAITHVASSSGAIMPVEAIGKIARQHNIFYLVDACQSVGQLPIDVEAMGCDMLCATGRKYLRAPRGTGFLYVRKAVLDQLSVLLMDGHSAKIINGDKIEFRPDARRFEVYEKNRALVLGLGKAVEYALHIGMERIAQRLQALAALLRTELGKLHGVTVHDHAENLGGIVTFSVEGIDCIAVKQQLNARNINVTADLGTSTPVYMRANGLDGLVRASVHYYNTEEEVTLFCEALKAIIAAK